MSSFLQIILLIIGICTAFLDQGLGVFKISVDGLYCVIDAVFL
jgi:hypothetical protein